MSISDCFRSTGPCMFDDCHQGAAYLMYGYLGAYHWSAQVFYACHEHVEQLAALHHVTASDIVPF
jgi:hypothetical protein